MFDAIVFATGFDAMTGAIVGGRHHRPRRPVAEGQMGRRPVDLSGADHHRVSESVLHHRPRQPVGAVEHGGLDRAARRQGRRLLWRTARRTDSTSSNPPRSPRPAGCSTSTTAPTSRCSPSPNSWYVGANMPGKPRAFMPYAAGVDFYRAACDEVVARDYLGFRRSGRERDPCVDGVVRRLQPDVQMVLERDGRDGPAAAGVDDRRAGARLHGLESAASARRVPTSARSSTACCPAPPANWLPAVPTADPGSAPDRGLLPRRRLGSRRRAIGRSAVPRSVRAHRRAHRLGRTTATRPSTASPQRSRTAWPRCGGWPTTLEQLGGDPGQLVVVRLERGRGHRRRGVPTRPRRGRAGHRRPGPADTGHRQRPDPRLLRRECARATTCTPH